jgi:hypothetical protein
LQKWESKMCKSGSSRNRLCTFCKIVFRSSDWSVVWFKSRTNEERRQNGKGWKLKRFRRRGNSLSHSSLQNFSECHREMKNIVQNVSALKYLPCLKKCLFFEKVYTCIIFVIKAHQI